MIGVAVAVAAVAAAASGPHLADPHPCPGVPGFSCSTLTVPLDRSGRVPGTLALGVAAENDARPPRGVLLFLTGGPGQSGVPYAGRLARTLARAAPGYRIVVYDQRGTGGTALRCPALQRQLGSSDLFAPTATAVRACGAAIGRARGLYGTDDVVADMDDLRRALRARELTLDGVSYGTYVAERYALAYPTHVERMVLDSVVPHAFGPALVPVELHAVARVLALACGTSRCASDLAAVVRKRGDGVDVLAALTLLSIVDPTYRDVFDVPAILHDARLGRPAPLARMVATTRRWSAAPAAALSQGLHAAALCSDWRFPWGDSTAPLTGRERALRRFAAAVPLASLWPFDRATLTGNGFVRECLAWPPAAPTPPALQRLPPVPTLLLSGDRDLSTPLEWARREAAAAPRGRLLVVHGAGHSIQSRSHDIGALQAVSAFLNR